MTKREHRLAFVLLVRELYGRLKALKRLRSLEIEWYVCLTIQSMTLEYALQLFYETEFEEEDEEVRGIKLKRKEDLTRTSEGWWGPITTADLRWLGLSWSTKAEQQAKADTQQLLLLANKQSNVEPNTSYAQLADPFHRRVGRIWEECTSSGHVLTLGPIGGSVTGEDLAVASSMNIFGGIFTPLTGTWTWKRIMLCTVVILRH
ncbi:MAG: hypothetical protein JOS17DRAFT_738306 [Linnemannia elongata]|nr:MAG: hypothetical protein JOS17DRAFT_738306 [Linnemannia elongata]